MLPNRSHGKEGELIKRAIIVGNCQVHALSLILPFFCPEMRFEYFSVHLLGADRAKKIAEFVETAVDDDTIIISQPLSEIYGPLSSDRIRDNISNRVVLIHNLYFSGHHPDLTYIGGLSRRVVSPIGEYHSKLAAAAFCLGKSLEQSENLFCYDVFERIGFFGESEASLREFSRREMTVDVSFLSDLTEITASRYCFLAVNHPTGGTIARYARKIADTIAQIYAISTVRTPVDIEMYPNTLATNAVFPVYPEIVKYHELDFEGSYLFKRPANSKEKSVLSLGDFLREEFKSFEVVGATELRKAVQIKDFMALRGVEDVISCC
jgi:hypothetical protein